MNAHSAYPLTPWPGGLRSSTNLNTVALGTSGGISKALDHMLERLTDTYDSFCWGTTDFSWSISHGSKENGAKVKCSPVPGAT